MVNSNYFKSAVRTYIAKFVRLIPRFKGEGRILLYVDNLLTDYSDPQSYIVQGDFNDGVPFEFDLRPWGQKFAYYYGEWERKYIRILRNLYKMRGGTFVDVGSSLGLYVCCLGEDVLAVGEKIVSIEPITFNLERQKRNVKLIKNLESALVYVPVALGSEPGQVRIHVDPLHADNNAYVSGDGEFKVEVRRFDEVLQDVGCSANVGVIKMDVEGWEVDIIRGAVDTIRRNRPIIFGEFLRERMDIYGFDMEEVSKLLIKELDYSVHIVRNGVLVALSESDIGCHENIFFLPK